MSPTGAAVPGFELQCACKLFSEHNSPLLCINYELSQIHGWHYTQVTMVQLGSCPKAKTYICIDSCAGSLSSDLDWLFEDRKCWLVRDDLISLKHTSFMPHKGRTVIMVRASIQISKNFSTDSTESELQYHEFQCIILV